MRSRLQNVLGVRTTLQGTPKRGRVILQYGSEEELETIYAALERLDAEKGSAVYVGDTEVDMLTAANAGMDGICVSWGYRRREELEALHAPAIADTAAELLAML